MLLMDGDGETSQLGPLVGQWSRVTNLQASDSRAELRAKHEPINMEASDAHNH
jgi:hypothetical protein